jgi:iron complex transport system substrate-binding protein
MRAVASCLLASLLGMTPGRADPVPQRVMSLSMCTDALLLELLPPERIASLSFYAHQSPSLSVWPQAARIPVNYGTAEEVLALKPDMVLTGTYTTPAARRILRSGGFAILEVPPADDFVAIRRVTRLVAHALARDPVAVELLARMDATLGLLADSRPAHPIRVVAWGEGGSIPGRGTLFDAILQAAGGINIAHGKDPAAAYAAFDLEQLLRAEPDVIAYSSGTLDTPGLNTDLAVHPVLLRHFAGRRITYPAALYACGTPASARAAETLRAALLSAVGGER